MNFFESQERARRHTGLLVLYFGAAVLLIVAAVDAVVVGGLAFANPHVRYALTQGQINAQILGWTSAAVLAVIGISALLKMSALAGGGPAVAALLGGRRVLLDTRDEGERRLLNIVEEMSIAAGMAVPAVFVLPSEQGINAFAAGNSPNTAAVTVSRGALDLMSREELQGVVAHEFSHIFNGDMRLNLRLIGILSGILAVAMIGRGILQGMGRASSGRSSGKGAGGAAVVGLIGLGLLVVGYIGVFFAQLIKSAISRQREFLADASAVQFTRNPSGILGALVRIRDGAGSRLLSANAEEVSHFLFAEGLASFFATHPPIESRIRAIDPDRLLEGKVASLPRPERAKAGVRVSSPSGTLAAVAGFGGVSRGASVEAPAPAAVTASVGRPTNDHLEAAAQFLSTVPSLVRARLETSVGARAVVYTLLLDPGEGVRRRQLGLLGGEASLVEVLYPLTSPLGPAARLPLTGMAVPALRAQTPAEREEFFARVHALVVEDNRVLPFEILMELFLDRSLRGAEASAQDHDRDMKTVFPDVVVSLSFLAHAGQPGDPAGAERAFKSGLEPLGPGVRAAILSPLEAGPEALRSALDSLNGSTPAVRSLVLEALASCALSDRKVTIEEWETLRVFGAALDCPIPSSVAISNVA